MVGFGRPHVGRLFWIDTPGGFETIDPAATTSSYKDSECLSISGLVGKIQA